MGQGESGQEWREVRRHLLKKEKSEPRLCTDRHGAGQGARVRGFPAEKTTKAKRYSHEDKIANLISENKPSN